MRRKISRQKDILGGKVKPQYDVIHSMEEEDDIEVIAAFTLQGKQLWTGEKMLSLVGSYEKFKTNVLILAERDPEYKLWLQTTSQNELAGEWGMDQSTVSRLLGPIQREYKNDLKVRAKALREEGKSIKEIIDYLQIDVDESTVSRWVRDSPKSDNSKPAPVATEGPTQYELKIYKLEAELKKEREKNEKYRKEIKELKAKLAKYADA